MAPPPRSGTDAGLPVEYEITIDGALIEYAIDGLRPFWYFCRLVNPSPAGSQEAHELLLVVVPSPPKYSTRHQSGIPSQGVLTPSIAPVEICEPQSLETMQS